MGKVTITIADRENGKVGIKMEPSIQELMEMCKRLGDENVPPSIWYAIAAAAEFKKLSKLANDVHPDESAAKAKLWMPAYQNIKKLIT